MTEPERVELAASVDESAIEAVQDHLEGLWQRHPDVADIDRIRFETGLIEILGNIVEHAFGPEHDDGTRRLEVLLQVHDDRIEAVLEDNGLPGHIDLSGAVMPGDDAESGRGLPLAKATLDHIGYERIEDRNHWDLVCSRTGS